MGRLLLGLAGTACIAGCGRLGFDTRNVVEPDAPVPVPALATYELEEGTGQAIRNTAGVLDGVLDGVLGRSVSVENRDPTWGSGLRGIGLVFDDVDDVVRIPYLTDQFPSNSSPHAEITMSAWIFPIPSPRFRVIFEIGGESNGATIGLLDTGHVRFILRDDTGTPDSVVLDSTVILDRSAWFHIAASSGPDGISLFIFDAAGTLIDSVTSLETYVLNAGSDGIAIGNNPVGNSGLLGQLNAGNEAFGGTIDEVRLYDVAISRDQIDADVAASP